MGESAMAFSPKISVCHNIRELCAFHASVPLKQVYEGCCWTPSGSLPMCRSPEDQFGDSLTILPEAVPSKLQPSLTQLLR